MTESPFYAIGSAEGFAEAKRRIAQAVRTGADGLDLGGLGLTEIPGELMELGQQLKVLYLDVAKDVRENPSLQFRNDVKKKCNAVSELPPAFFTSLHRLERLYLDSNQLAALPEAIGQLSALQLLNLENNQLVALPQAIGNLAALQHLSLNNNQLAALPEAIGQLAALKRLFLNNNQLAALPEAIGQLAALERLFLNNNQLVALPQAIRQLSALQQLDLDNNQLAALPESIGQLSALRVLYLDNNQLAALPEAIGQLSALETLYLENNQLAALPEAIGQLSALQHLVLNNNHLAALPEAIGQLSALQQLDLDNNQLAALPESIGQLSALQVLYLENNQLAALPEAIGQLSALQQLHLNNNPLPTAFQKAYDAGGIEALSALLRAFYKDADLIYEAKLLITGEGNVGKSWALAALQDQIPAKAVGKQTTYGVDRGELRLPHPAAGRSDKISEDTEIHLNTWDFGGQQVYRITHQFFFSENAVFLLVWNPRTGAEQCRVREWLRTIHLRTGGKAKVIIVASQSPKKDTPYYPEYGHDALPSELQAMIVDRIAIESAKGPEGDNIPELKAMIAKHAATLPQMGQPFPVAWAKARDAVSALNPPGKAKTTPHIPYGRFEEICRANEVTEADQIRTLATVFMNNTGRAIYYGDHAEDEDGLLAGFMVLDAEWLSRAFVQVLEDKPTREASGLLDHQRLDVIWRRHGHEKWKEFPKEYHRFLIGLMRVFQISYVLKAAKGRKSLIPQLLPAAEPAALPWRVPPATDGALPVRLICDMDNEAEGLMPRFIVETSDYHQFPEGGRGLHWRNGVFLKETTFGNEALVRIEGRERPILTVSVAGKQPGWFLAQLYPILRELLDFWPGLGSIPTGASARARKSSIFSSRCKTKPPTVNSHAESA